jgi:hypothetical protein
MNLRVKPFNTGWIKKHTIRKYFIITDDLNLLLKQFASNQKEVMADITV